MSLETLEGAGRDTDMDEVERVLALVEGGHGVSDIAAGIRCETGAGIVTFAAPVVRYDPVPVSLHGETVIPGDGGIIEAENDAGDSAVDGRNSIIVAPGVTGKYGRLTVGLAKRGERMTPYGKMTSVKIRELLSAVSFPGIIRDMVPVIRAGGVAVWIPGIRSSELLRVSRAAAKHADNSGGAHEPVVLTYRNGLNWRSPE